MLECPIINIDFFLFISCLSMAKNHHAQGSLYSNMQTADRLNCSSVDQLASKCIYTYIDNMATSDTNFMENVTLAKFLMP